MVGEKIMGARSAWRSFQAAIRRSASSSTCASVARRVAASLSLLRRGPILRLAAVEAHALYEFRFYHGRSLRIGAIFVNRLAANCEGAPQLSHDLVGSAHFFHLSN